MNLENDDAEEICNLVFAGRRIQGGGGNHLKNISKAFLDKLREEEEGGRGCGLERELGAGASELERVTNAQKYFRWMPIGSQDERDFAKLEKNSKISSTLRERGNEAWKKNKFWDALRNFNLAICFGRPGQEETGLAYANRAAIFLRLQHPQLALRDIQLAKRNAFPSTLFSKLEERQKKCQQLIEENKQKTTSNNGSLAETTNAKKKPSSDGKDPHQILEISNLNSTIVGADEVVEIGVCEERGRFLRVTKDVEAGRLLLTEKPFATVLEKELVWDTEHCQLCLKRIMAGIPCDECTFAMYCDEDCKEEGLQFHKWEHRLWAYLHGSDSSHRDLLAVRILAKCGIETLVRNWGEFSGGKRQEEEKKNKKRVPGCNAEGIYDSQSYLSVYNLVSHGESASFEQNSANCFKALLLSYLLRDMTTFLSRSSHINSQSASLPRDATAAATDDHDLMPQELMRNQEDQLVLYVASLLLHKLESIPFNVISLNELIRTTIGGAGESSESAAAATTSPKLLLDDKVKSEATVIKSVAYASAVFGLLSLCNHSCCPTAIHVRRTENQQTALITMTNLKAGQEICITYGPCFTVHGKSERQAVLGSRYKFRCDCPACVQNWPLRDQGFKEGVSRVEKSMEEVLRQAYGLQQEHKFADSYQLVRGILRKHSQTLAPNHPLILMAQDIFKIAIINLMNG